MRRTDDGLVDPDAAAAVLVIDATLAGRVVDPEHAELAELALILAGQRPQADAEFAAGLDRRVARRFAPPAAVGDPVAGERRRRRRRVLLAPAAMAGLAAGVAAALALSSTGTLTSTGTSTSSGTSPRPRSAARAPGKAAAAARGSATTAEASTSASAGAAGSAASSQSSSASSPAVPGPGQGSAASPVTPAVAQAPTPPTTHRQVVQSAQLSLSARPAQLESVVQQVFDVIGATHGVVNSSSVTAGADAGGYAQLQLSVPSANLQPALVALSALHGAAVLSRSDSSQDITGQVGGAGRTLADARALRTSLLRRLATATTATEIDSLRRQIRDAEASISSDLSTLRGLHRQVDYTQISITVTAAPAPARPVSSGGSFTLGQAAHDAGRVLVVVAGVALIALAGLVPLSLLAVIGLWGAYVARRRRREQALDLI